MTLYSIKKNLLIKIKLIKTMVDIKQLITYLYMFGIKNTFHTNQKPKVYTLMGGVLTLLSFFYFFITKFR